MYADSTATPPAPQSCLRCRRVLTKREQHDALEECVLATIREQHPEWTDASVGGDPHVEYYRALLRQRKRRNASARAARLRERIRRYRWRARLRALARKYALQPPTESASDLSLLSNRRAEQL
jgi:hypothetical protein